MISKLRLQPRFFSCWIKQTRNCPPTIESSNAKFQISINVQDFKRDELKVKARSEFVVVEGKQEKNDPSCHYIRRFERKFRLPADCNVRDMKSELTSEGILTISAPRNIKPPCDIQINICGDPDECKDVPVTKPDELVKIPVKCTEDEHKTPPNKCN